MQGPGESWAGFPQWGSHTINSYQLIIRVGGIAVAGAAMAAPLINAHMHLTALLMFTVCSNGMGEGGADSLLHVCTRVLYAQRIQHTGYVFYEHLFSHAYQMYCL